MVAISQPVVCEKRCGCCEPHGKTKLVVLTGGPGAGKTAVLEIIRKELCEHVVILPEAASVVFGGGFWRLNSVSARMASQRAILHVQQELENIALGEDQWSLGLCDRGTLDALAYWPGDEQEFWQEARSSRDAEYQRYYSVIHLRVPTDELGYNHDNPLRIETAPQAAAIDERIHAIWSKHPRYRMVDSDQDFLIKAKKVLHHIKEDMPPCCMRHLTFSA